MNKNNISKLFYKDYYRGVDFHYIFRNGDAQENESIKSINKKILTDSKLVPIPQVSIGENQERNVKVSAKVLYPGLITGTGLVHDSKKLEGAFNLGMHFDYTYGMPIVYGSSVKGVLRSYFEEFATSPSGEKLNSEAKDLLLDIFEGKVRTPENDRKDNNGKIIEKAYRNKSIYQRDVFFDAVIVDVYRDSTRSHLLEDDSITPHGDNPLKNPIPITMLKIAAGCKIEFRFRLGDSIIGGVKYAAADKLAIFKEILETVGVGAKTNVGYGQLEIL